MFGCSWVAVCGVAVDCDVVVCFVSVVVSELWFIWVVLICVCLRSMSWAGFLVFVILGVPYLFFFGFLFVFRFFYLVVVVLLIFFYSFFFFFVFYRFSFFFVLLLCYCFFVVVGCLLG